jgi:hypothetical protein
VMAPKGVDLLQPEEPPAAEPQAEPQAETL